MTLDELRQKEDKVKALVDAWDDEDRLIAYAHLHRSYGVRISDCERTLAGALLGEDRNKGARP